MAKINKLYLANKLLPFITFALGLLNIANQLFICEAYDHETTTLSHYARMRQLFPKVTNNEAIHWRMVDNDNFKQHPCKRTCIVNQTMTCYYYMVVHYDETMGDGCNRYLDAKYRYKIGDEEYIDSFGVHEFKGPDDCKYADGVKSEVMVVNGRLPGQPIEVCWGDTIVADVINSMHETTTIHWHGLHQRNTPHMDGVPHITQYPIEAGQAFRYRFEVDQAGTHWWHSHTDHQRAFGLAGSLIARKPREFDPHVRHYDFDNTEHTIMIQDWVHNFDESIAQNLLINGAGRNVHAKNSQSQQVPPTLYAKFSVVRGGRYRFRVIFNGISNCPITLSIDQHDLVVIASDGNDIEPITVQNLVLLGGERFDFVLHANQGTNNYWLRLKGHKSCELNQLHQEAIIHYVGADRNANPNGAPPSYAYKRAGIVLNPINQDPQNDDDKSIPIVDANALPSRMEPSIIANDGGTFYTSMRIDNRIGTIFQMDDITFTMPKLSLLQTRNLGIGTLFCNKTQQAALGFNCRTRHCKCTNVIQVPAFKHVEFVVSSISPSPHPIHLHGYTFRVVGMGILGEQDIQRIEEIDRRTPLPRRTRGAPLKDSVQVPAYGYTILRFYTDNPGYWIFHCHISTHSENGMAAVMRVGEDIQMKMCPVSNCGLCSSVV